MIITITDGTADVLDRMLLAAPNQRFQSAQEVITVLSPVKTTSRQVPSKKASPATQPPIPRARTVFSTLELLARAGFSGFEGGLVAIALHSLLKNLLLATKWGLLPVASLGLSSLILGSLIFAQTRRWIDNKDLVTFAGITLASIILFPHLRNQLTINVVVVLALSAGLVAIALTALFRLIYKLLALIIP